LLNQVSFIRTKLVVVFGQTQPAPANNIFGGGAFGATQPNQQQQQQQQQQQPSAFNSGLFGQKPAGTGLFGSTAPATTTTQPTSLFGGGFGQNNTQQQQQQQQQPSANTNAFGTGTSLFGQNKPATGLFGTQQPAAPTNNLFGSGNQSVLNVSALGSGQQPSLTASLDKPIGANLPIFDLLGPGPRSIILEPPRKKTSLVYQPPSHLSYGYTPAQSRLRGFNPPKGVTYDPRVTFGTASTSNAPLAVSASTAPVGSEAFFSGSTSTAPSFGTGAPARESVKKLVIDRHVEPADIFRTLGARPAPGSLKAGAKPTFSAALGIAAREKEAAAALALPAPPPPAAPSTTADVAAPVADKATPAPGEPREDEYYVRPGLDGLKKLGYDQLSAFPNLIIGRAGHGELRFLEPVNLTEVPRLTDLLGTVVQFGSKDCSIYPEMAESDKPPPGHGLNVPARIRIYGAWPLDRATKEPVRDVDSPLVAKHERRLRKIEGTKFESYDRKTGDWVFTVESF
jgi:nuclear pore complex protein Nup98-Nup96